ncbi:MAG: hypothetical protein GXP49_06700 [Deltaproteobacteria bacterium]|nr:hypothetical protein [Deltaproteobacteria bacterium]
MRKMGITSWILIVPVVAASSLFFGCRKSGEYQPPGYSPPPPPLPATQAPVDQKGPAPLKRVDLDNIPPKLTDPKDAADPSTDLKSVIAGIEDNEVVMRFETYGPPFTDNNTWYLAWLKTSGSPLIYKVQVSQSGHYILGGLFKEGKQVVEDVVISNDVEAKGNVVEARFPWSKLPKELQMRDLIISEPTIISAKKEGAKADVIDIIDGSDEVRL